MVLCTYEPQSLPNKHAFEERYGWQRNCRNGIDLLPLAEYVSLWLRLESPSGFQASAEIWSSIRPLHPSITACYGE